MSPKTDVTLTFEYIFLVLFGHFRVTQVYDTGACVYFYFGFRSVGLEDPVKIYESIEV